MPLEKEVTLASTIVAEYWRIDEFIWNRTRRTATAIYNLYVDAAAAVAGNPVGGPGSTAKLFLSGAAFDTYLAASVLASEDVLAKLEEACMDSCAAYNTGPTAGVIDPENHVVSDHGHDVFFDATEV